MLVAAIALGAIGLLCAAGLGIAAKVFYVEVDPTVAAVEEALPGANCGGCGFAGCASAAVAIATNKAAANICVACGEETHLEIAGLIGATIEFREPEKAKLNCRYGVYDAETEFAYDGVDDCRAAAMLSGGEKLCKEGCLGFGSCVKACPFDAIKLTDERLPEVDLDKCTGCGTCVRICPHNVLGLTSATNRVLAWNRLGECLAPCQRTCPAQIDIPSYIRAVANDKPLEAVRIIKEHNPMPLSIGRVCPHDCETVCRRKYVDEPVAINFIKRYAADYELFQNQIQKPYMLPDTEHKVAVVGGGPAGIACAYYLRSYGHAVTIFEAMPELGGMLRYGIPEYRLPKRKILDKEIQMIMDLGIETRTGQKLGEDFSLEDLKAQGFDASFVANGAWISRGMGLEGENEIIGAVAGTDFLIERGLDKFPWVGKNVAVIGGGNTAMDCCRTAKRLGAESVTCLYRRTEAEMPANVLEIHEAKREGVEFHFLAAPTALKGEKGKLVGVELIEMELGEPDASGRRRPEPKEGSEHVLPIDMIVAAIGQFPDLDFLPDDGNIGKTRWNTIETHPETLATDVEGIFAGGDAVLGPATAVEALAQGRKAARSINLYLKGRPVEPTPMPLFPKQDPWPVISEIPDIPQAPREAMPELEPEEREQNWEEVETGFDKAIAKREADRCLQCGLYCYNRSKSGGRKA